MKPMEEVDIKIYGRVLEGRHEMDQKLRVGILGATGMVGQRFIALSWRTIHGSRL